MSRDSAPRRSRFSAMRCLTAAIRDSNRDFNKISQD